MTLVICKWILITPFSICILKSTLLSSFSLLFLYFYSW